MALNMITRPFIQLRGMIKRSWQDRASGKSFLFILLIAVVFYLVIATGLGIYWSMAPNGFSVEEKTKTRLQFDSQSNSQLITGSVTTSTLIEIMETLLEKPGGFLTNDLTPPGVWLDNQPNWEYGVLIQARDMAKAMRESFSRSQSQSTEDSDLAKAESRLNVDNKSWVLPSAEAEYRDGLKFLNNYLVRLSDTQQSTTQFYARADNLRYWLATVETRLGSLSQRLSASVGQKRLNTDLAGDADAKQSTKTSTEVVVKTPWRKIDDVFFEARGSAWAILHLLKAIELDFADVLERKNARVSLQQIIRELEATQEPIYSPLILNGSGFGMWANHSLVMASYISRANAALIDLRGLLAQG
ncbi:DUF2333 family protein [Sessilibacter corallicola]|uniref:DUF2333 family protein n=2 Tax=Sessilibacter corallicola TaxID=2904075 RepID=A0ABQ0AAS5_9GAMM